MREAAPAHAPWRPRRNLGLVAAAFVAWAVMVAKILLVPVVLVLMQGGAQHEVDLLGQLPAIALVLALYGLPIALVVTFLLGWPLWWIADDRGFRSRNHAVGLGAAAGAVLAFVMFVLQLASLGNAVSRGDNIGTSVLDGQFTAYGWLLVSVDSLAIVAAAMLAGYTAWRVSGIARHLT